jgi:hypothetical protein
MGLEGNQFQQREPFAIVLYTLLSHAASHAVTLRSHNICFTPWMHSHDVQD